MVKVSVRDFVPRRSGIRESDRAATWIWIRSSSLSSAAVAVTTTLAPGKTELVGAVVTVRVGAGISGRRQEIRKWSRH